MLNSKNSEYRTSENVTKRFQEIQVSDPIETSRQTSENATIGLQKSK